MLAAYYGDDLKTKDLMQRFKFDWLTANSNLGAMALFLAVERKHTAVVEALLTAGLTVDTTDSIGQTSLHRATRRECEPLVRLLLHNGAEVDRKNDEGRTAWSANVRRCNESIVSMLIEAGADPCIKGHDGVTELYEAAAKGETEYVKLLLRSGTDPSITTQYHWAPMHWAASNGNIDCVKVLIEAGADLSPVSDQGSTPLDMAFRANQHTITNLLTQAGARRNHDTNNPDTPLNNIASSQQHEQDGAEIDAFNIPRILETQDVLPPEKLALSFDKPLGQALIFGQFIYPSNFHGTRDYFYHVSHPLNTSITSISLRHTKRFADSADYPIGPEKFFPTGMIYEIFRTSLDYQELELRESSASPLSGVVKMHRGWTGGWEVHTGTDRDTTALLFRTTPEWSTIDDKGFRWVTAGGQLLAKSALHLGAPALTFEPGQDCETQDILVACWVAKLWSETVTLQKRDK